MKSEQFNHLTLIHNLENSRKIGKNRKFWESFSWRGGGGSPISKSKWQNSDQKVISLFVKTKNASKDLKYKISHIIFFKIGV